MGESSDQVEVYLEVGKKRVFAGAIDWPGWCRSGRDEDSAMQALFESGPRYERVLRTKPVRFQAPKAASSLMVVERLEGTGTTDFGAPDVPPSIDARSINAADLSRFQAVLEACWLAFDAAARAAEGQELRKGPRGGGRDVDAIVQHVLGADAAYLSRLGWKQRQGKAVGPGDALRQTRQAILKALATAAEGQIPSMGSRGSPHWKPRYFVRRVVWHVLDHAWEIEDRLERE